MRLKLVLAAVLFAGTTGAAYPADDVIHLRQALMNSNNEAVTLIVAMLRKQTPWDADIAAAALTTVSHDNDIFPVFFPDGTQNATDPDPANKTYAKPEIWSDMAGFQELSAKMAKDAATAATTAADYDPAASPAAQPFFAAFKAVSDNCNACHDKYRFEIPD